MIQFIKVKVHPYQPSNVNKQLLSKHSSSATLGGNNCCETFLITCNEPLQLCGGILSCYIISSGFQPSLDKAIPRKVHH